MYVCMYDLSVCTTLSFVVNRLSDLFFSIVTLILFDSYQFLSLLICSPIVCSVCRHIIKSFAMYIF